MILRCGFVSPHFRFLLYKMRRINTCIHIHTKCIHMKALRTVLSIWYYVLFAWFSMHLILIFLYLSISLAIILPKSSTLSDNLSIPFFFSVSQRFPNGFSLVPPGCFCHPSRLSYHCLCRICLSGVLFLALLPC